MSDEPDLCEYPATNGPCSNPATTDEGYCWLATHSDDEDAPDREPDGRGAPEGNKNAAKAAVWAESFYDGFLTEAEKKRVHESAEVLGSKAGAQEIARHAASVCLEQFRRTGDERFLRRYESICDKAGIYPEDAVNVDVEQRGEFSLNITRQVVGEDDDA